MILRILIRFIGAVLFWGRWEGMSLLPFAAGEDWTDCDSDDTPMRES